MDEQLEFVKQIASAEDCVRQLMAQRTQAERLQMCSRLFAGAKTLMQAGMAQQEGRKHASDMRRQLFLRLYSADFSENQRDTILKVLLQETSCD